MAKASVSLEATVDNEAPNDASIVPEPPNVQEEVELLQGNEEVSPDTSAQLNPAVQEAADEEADNTSTIVEPERETTKKIVSRNQYVQAAVEKMLRNDPKLTEIHLDGKEIIGEGAKVLAEALRCNCTVKRLNLNHNFNVCDGGAHALAEALHENLTLTTLDLRGAQISDSGAMALAVALFNNSTLTELDLSNNKITNEGANALEEALRHNTSITYLNLSNNIESFTKKKLADEENMIWRLIEINNQASSPELALTMKAEEFGPMVEKANDIPTKEKEIADKCKEITALCGENNFNCMGMGGYFPNATDEVGWEKVRALVTEIVESDPVVAARVATHRFIYNNVGVECNLLEWMTEASAPLDIIQALEKAMDVSVQVALKRLERNDPTLTALDLRFMEFGDNGAMAVAKALLRNTTVTFLDLNNNKISDEGAKALVQALHHNSTITKIELATPLQESSDVRGKTSKNKISDFLRTKINQLTEINGHAFSPAAALSKKEEEFGPLEENANMIPIETPDVDFHQVDGSDETNDQETNPRMWAISYDQLIEFSDRALGGRSREVIKGISMREIVSEFVLPICERTGKSWALQHNQNGRHLDVFVTHSWDENFSSFVDSIRKVFSNSSKKPNLWICAFALLQGSREVISKQLGTDDDSFSLEDSPFVRALKGASDFLVVRNKKTDLYSRIWCVCELIVAKDIGLFPEKTQVTGGLVSYQGRLTYRFFNLKTSCVDAESSDEADKELILKYLREKHDVKEIDDFIGKLRVFL